MDMPYIMDSGQKWSNTTFPNIFSLISAESADLSQNQKKHFFKKNAIFLVENLPEKGQNWFNSKTTIVPSPHEHSLQTYNNGFFISQHRFFRHFPTHTPKMAIFAMNDQTHKWDSMLSDCLYTSRITKRKYYQHINKHISW